MTRAVSIAQGGSNNVTMRNRIINGDFRIDQRNNGAAVTNLNADVTFFTDMWRGYNSAGSKFTGQRVTTSPPSGFTYYMKLTSLSAYSSLGAADQFQFSTPIEGLNFVDMNWGATAAAAGQTAKPVTLSFWVNSTLTGSFPISIRNSGNPSYRTYITTFSISSANTWQQVSITIPGDTSGTWATDNTMAFQMTFCLGAGSNFTTSTTNAWQTGNFLAPSSGVVNFVSNNAAVLNIAGVQLEAGTTATPFEQRLHGTELVLCQRYFEILWTSSINWQGNVASIYNTQRAFIKAWHKATKRVSPTITITSPSFTVAYNNSIVTATASSNQYPTTDSTSIEVTGSYTLGYSGHIDINSGCVITASAEL